MSYKFRLERKILKRKKEALELDERVEKFYVTKKGHLINAIVKDYSIEKDIWKNDICYARVNRSHLEPLEEDQIMSKKEFNELVKKGEWREIL